MILGGNDMSEQKTCECCNGEGVVKDFSDPCNISYTLCPICQGLGSFTENLTEIANGTPLEKKA